MMRCSTHLLQRFHVLNGLQHVTDVRIEDHAAHDDLVENVIDLIWVKYEVELTHILEALVEHLDKDLDEVEHAELALGAVHGHDEIERCVMPVNELRILPEVAQAENFMNVGKRGGE